ncbi:MAG: type II secretion system F family protein [Planctomycetes bacterium]|nr:type II secretion system F family protein [Planctomycetota bacterium]
MDLQMAAYSMVFAAVVIFAATGYRVLSKGWSRYEDDYLYGAAHSLEQMGVSIPPFVLLYLSIASFLLAGGLAFAAFQNAILAFVLAIPFFFFPRLVQWLAQRRRQQLFGTQLVDALDNMSQALKVGFSIQQAIEMIAREMPPPIGQEFKVLRQQIQLGMPVDKALDGLATRINTEDMILVGTVVSVSKDVGGNLSEVFDKIAVTMRARFAIEGKIRSLTSQGKLQGIVVGLMPIFVGYMLHLVSPQLMEPMYQTTLGWIFICLIVILELLGFVFIRKIVNIEV